MSNWQNIERDEETKEPIDDQDESLEVADEESQTDEGIEEEESAGDGQQEDDFSVSIRGEEQQPAEESVSKAPAWVRDLRKSHRELQRKNRELEEKLKGSNVETKPTLGPKPTLEECDYDSEKFDASLSAWYEQKRKVDAEAEMVEAKKAQEQAEWQKRLDSYESAKAELHSKVRDYDEAEILVQEGFSQTQQGIILQGAENPAMLVYVLGKNPKIAEKLAAEKDPVKFAFAIAKLEDKLEVKTKKPVPPPERAIKGSGPVSATVDSQLERLRAKAEKTGDYSEVMAYKRQKKKS